MVAPGCSDRAGSSGMAEDVVNEVTTIGAPGGSPPWTVARDDRGTGDEVSA